MFEQVLAGHLPNGEVLTGGAKEHAPGFDLTFSAPKSVSLMALVGGDARLVGAHHESVQTAMKWVESHLAEARMGKDGHIVVATGKLAYALFTHDVSRELDPQLHTHSVVSNVTQRPDGAWRALHNGKIWNANMLIGAIYHNELRHAVEALGYGIVGGGKNGTFEIAGIDRQTIESWSIRNQQIRYIAEKLNITSPEGRHAIAERSREAKAVADPASVRQAWRDMAAERGHDFRGLVPEQREVGATRGVLATIRAWGEALLAQVTPYFRAVREPLISDSASINRAPLWALPMPLRRPSGTCRNARLHFPKTMSCNTLWALPSRRRGLAMLNRALPISKPKGSCCMARASSNPSSPRQIWLKWKSRSLPVHAMALARR
jgi:conjugative relaxase-like TrwC/TraI family protein